MQYHGEGEPLSPIQVKSEERLLSLKTLFEFRPALIQAEFPHGFQPLFPLFRIEVERIVQPRNERLQFVSRNTPRMDPKSLTNSLELVQLVLAAPFFRSVGRHQATIHATLAGQTQKSPRFFKQRAQLQMAVRVVAQAGTSPKAIGAEMILLGKLKASTRAQASGLISEHKLSTSFRMAFDFADSR